MGTGVKGGAPPSPTLCQSIRYTLAQHPWTASHLLYGESDWSQEPLLLWELFFFPAGLRPTVPSSTPQSWWSLYQGTAHTPPAQGQRRSDMKNVLLTLLPCLQHSEGASSPWSSHAQTRNKQLSQCGDRQETERFRGVACVRTSGCDEGVGAIWTPNYRLQGAPQSS